MSAASHPLVAFLEDADACHTLASALMATSLRLQPQAPLPAEPFLALLDSTRADLLPLAERLSGMEVCRALILFGDPPVLPEVALPVRILPRPIRIADLAAYSEKLWHSLYQPPRRLTQELLFDPRARSLLRTSDGLRLDLTAKEADMLDALAAAGAEGMERESLLRDVWGYRTALETHTLETHIYRLRQKLERLGDALTLRVEQGRCRLIY